MRDRRQAAVGHGLGAVDQGIGRHRHRRAIRHDPDQLGPIRRFDRRQPQRQDRPTGLDHRLADERSGGDLLVTLSDPDAFKVGETLATAKGYVVHETPLFQLIRYEPTTEKVFAKPLLLVPPWINKFYILDLQPENSFVRYAVEQGHSVFMVSWRNPDARHAEWGFDAYGRAVLDALDATCAISRGQSWTP